VQDKYGGQFIVLDGPDGCGKTTQTKLLAQWLTEQGVSVAVFRDPGGTAIGEKIRQILLSPKHDAMSTAAEVLLYMAARAQLWEEKIAPALQDNNCVLLDRWLSSTCTYQGYAGDFGMDNVVTVATNCLKRVWPDLTLILDVDPATGLQRLNRKFDRIEQKDIRYHRKVREGFLRLVEKEPNFAVVDAGDDIESIQTKIRQTVAEASLT
jgi:dTMP kinase